jgi:hypothetical protein
MLVPGAFGNDPEHCVQHDNVSCPLDKQEAQLLLKMQGYIAWMKADPMIAGFKGWHFASFGESDHSTFAQTIGVQAFPAVVDELIGLGRYIISDEAGLDPPPPSTQTLVAIAGPWSSRLKYYAEAWSAQACQLNKSDCTFRARPMAIGYPELVGAQAAAEKQALLGADIIVVRAVGNATVWLPPAGWMEMNHPRSAKMTFSGGLHGECHPDTLSFPNASQYFSYCRTGVYAFSTNGNFAAQTQGHCTPQPAESTRGGDDSPCAAEMYVREGSIVPTDAARQSSTAGVELKLFPGLCPAVLWRGPQFGGPRPTNCQNKTPIGGPGRQCPIYGRWPCSGVLDTGDIEKRTSVNLTQVRMYSPAAQAMAISLELRAEGGECASSSVCGRGVVMHMMHTSQPTVLNVTIERRPNGDAWKGAQPVPSVAPPAVVEAMPIGGWWLAREGAWWVVVVSPPHEQLPSIKDLSSARGAARLTVLMW